MFSDRFYLRSPDPEEKLSLLFCLLAAVIAAFVVELVSLTWFRDGAALIQNLEVTVPALQHGRLWTLLTYGFVHWNTAQNLLHVVVVIMGLVIFGRELLPSLGPVRFIALYAGALILGALTWAGANWSHPEAHLFGAMAGVYALLAVFACLHPDRDFSFTVFFFPVTTKPRHLAVGLVAMEFMAFLFYEVYRAAAPFSYAPSAHLGGVAAGLIYCRFFHANRWASGKVAEAVEPVRMPAIKPTGFPVHEATRASAPARDELRAEVDRILDKINSSGLGALTAAEKQVLDEAKHQLSRR
jgi:hypothetical protein